MSATSEKVNLLGLSRAKMEAFFSDIGEKRFRAVQVMKWIHQHGVDEFDQMTNVGKALREKLKQVAEIRGPEVVLDESSDDGTRKWVLRLDGGNCIETVLIPDPKKPNRNTLCVSSQVGCALDCSFCSTGKQGFNRDLAAAEIIGQVWVAVHSSGTWKGTENRPVSNVVMMGMGEPLLNFDAVVDAMHLMKDDDAYGLSKRRVTLSTSGVVPALDKLGEVCDVSLAVSLHAPNDALRNELVPLNKKYPIAELMAACRRYLATQGDSRVVTIEYTLIDGVNDQPHHARELGRLLRALPCKINLIPFNPFPNSNYRRSPAAAVKAFQEILMQAGYTATIRSTRGDDIDAACGQLVGRVQDRTRRSQRYIQAAQLDSGK